MWISIFLLRLALFLLIFWVVVCFVYFLLSWIFFFLKFDYSCHFFSLSSHFPLGEVVPLLRFEIGHRGVSELYNWYIGRQEACESSYVNGKWMLCWEETVNEGVGRTMPGHGAVSGCLTLAGRSGRRRQLFFNISMYPFENPWTLQARCWNGEKCS